jgi:hypothetical protein
LSAPGTIALLWPGEWARGLPWLPVALAVFSGLLLLIGVTLLWQGLRRFLRFSPVARLKLRHRH